MATLVRKGEFTAVPRFVGFLRGKIIAVEESTHVHTDTHIYIYVYWHLDTTKGELFRVHFKYAINYNARQNDCCVCLRGIYVAISGSICRGNKILG